MAFVAVFTRFMSDSRRRQKRGFIVWRGHAPFWSSYAHAFSLLVHFSRQVFTEQSHYSVLSFIEVNVTFTRIKALGEIPFSVRIRTVTFTRRHLSPFVPFSGFLFLILLALVSFRVGQEARVHTDVVPAKMAPSDGHSP